MTWAEIVLMALDNEEVLSTWEWDFIQNVADKENDWVPTPKQQNVLNNIWGIIDG